MLVVQRDPSERRLRRMEAPGLVRHAAERKPRRADAPTIACDRGRRGDQRELVGLAVAELQGVRGATFRAGGAAARGEKKGPTAHGGTVRCVAWQARDIGERDPSLARWA